MFGTIVTWKGLPTPLDTLGGYPEIYFAEGDCEGPLSLIVLRLGTETGFLVRFRTCFMCLAVDEVTYCTMSGPAEFIGPGAILHEAVASPMAARLSRESIRALSEPNHFLLAGGNMYCEILSGEAPDFLPFAGPSMRKAFPTDLRFD